jgi:hypothetical protein
MSTQQFWATTKKTASKQVNLIPEDLNFNDKLPLNEVSQVRAFMISHKGELIST